jgi:hypothetical protein
MSAPLQLGVTTMADATHRAGAVRPAIAPGVMEIPPQAARSLLQDLQGARALLRAVIVAEAAVAAQSIDWGPNSNGPGRWSPVMSEVCRRLDAVRETVMNTRSFDSLEWPGLLRTAEALDAALWHALGSSDSDALESGELVAASRVLVAMLDDALRVCADEGVPLRAAECDQA